MGPFVVFAERSSVTLAALLVVIAATGNAGAQERPFSKYEVDRTGFFLRFGLGLEAMRDTATVETFVHHYDWRLSANEVTLDVAAGGSVARGIAIGGGALFTTSTSARIRGRDGSTRRDGGGGSMLLGALIDVYPYTRWGLHGGAVVGYQTLEINDSDREVDSTWSKGIGLAPHVGYEAMVADGWSMGVLGRVRFARMAADTGDGLPTGVQRDSVWSGGLELTLTRY
jgi:hypothetical protein